MIGYLDIETSFRSEVTVVGLLRSDRGIIQIVGDAITSESVQHALRGLDTLCTFNGESFDLPVLRRALGLGLLERYRSLDLSIDCRRKNRRGGLKKIEASLSIPRRSNGINGVDAMLLWDRWKSGERQALRTLLAYNRDDVVNLALLERRLRGDLEMPPTFAEPTVLGA